MAAQHGLEGVARLQQHIDHARRRGQLVAAQLVEQRLHLMGELGHVRETKRRGAPFDGVRAAEDGVEFFVVGGLDVELQQELLHVLQVLTGFFKEDLVELAEVDPRR